MRSSAPDQELDNQRSGGDGIQPRDNRRLAAVVFGFGMLVGMVILGASVYADFESSLFEVFLKTNSKPGLVTCPILMSAEEGGAVSTNLKNNGSAPIERLVRVNISRGHRTVMRDIEEQVTLAPGEEVELFWEITKKDTSYGHLVFAKVQVSEDDRNPLQRGSCGILVLDLPLGLKGKIVVTAMYSVSFVCILLAIGIWWGYGRTYTGLRKEALRAMIVLGFVVLVGLLFAIPGLWQFAAVSFYIAILAVGVVVPHFVINLLRAN